MVETLYGEPQSGLIVSRSTLNSHPEGPFLTIRKKDSRSIEVERYTLSFDRFVEQAIDNFTASDNPSFEYELFQEILVDILEEDTNRLWGGKQPIFPKVARSVDSNFRLSNRQTLSQRISGVKNETTLRESISGSVSSMNSRDLRSFLLELYFDSLPLTSEEIKKNQIAEENGMITFARQNYRKGFGYDSEALKNITIDCAGDISIAIGDSYTLSVTLQKYAPISRFRTLLNTIDFSELSYFNTNERGIVRANKDILTKVSLDVPKRETMQPKIQILNHQGALVIYEISTQVQVSRNQGPLTISGCQNVQLAHQDGEMHLVGSTVQISEAKGDIDAVDCMLEIDSAESNSFYAINCQGKVTIKGDGSKTTILKSPDLQLVS